MKIRMTLAGALTLAVLPWAMQAPASAADYPLRHKRAVRVVAAPAAVPVAPACYRGRWTYTKYLPVLATDALPRSVYIEYPVPCDG